MKSHLTKCKQIMNEPPVICFLLDEQRDCPGRRRDIAVIRDTFPAAGIQYIILSESVTGEVLPEGRLVLTDSGAALRRLRAAGIPAVGYLHEGSRGEDFTGAAYLIEEPQELDPDSFLKIFQRLTGQPWTIAATDRLWIREQTVDDLDGLYELYDDPAARRFLEPLSRDREEEAQILKAYMEKVYGLLGYGMWAVCDRESGELIGRMGFAPYSGRQEAAQFGYLIRADVRRRGLAAEAAGAVLAFADRELEFPAIGAQTASDNAASAALLRRLGFTLQSEDNGTQYFIRERKQT